MLLFVANAASNLETCARDVPPTRQDATSGTVGSLPTGRAYLESPARSAPRTTSPGECEQPQAPPSDEVARIGRFVLDAYKPLLLDGTTAKRWVQQHLRGEGGSERRRVGWCPMSPKAPKDWFRSKTWTESDRQEFEARLARARRSGRA